jgi:hypothetical protein
MSLMVADTEVVVDRRTIAFAASLLVIFALMAAVLHLLLTA